MVKLNYITLAEYRVLLRERQVHILEADWGHSRLEQIYGRVVRFCSHKTLPKDEHNVIIYI